MPVQRRGRRGSARKRRIHTRNTDDGERILGSPQRMDGYPNNHWR